MRQFRQVRRPPPARKSRLQHRRKQVAVSLEIKTQKYITMPVAVTYRMLKTGLPLQQRKKPKRQDTACTAGVITNTTKKARPISDVPFKLG